MSNVKDILKVGDVVVLKEIYPSYSSPAYCFNCCAISSLDELPSNKFTTTGIVDQKPHVISIPLEKIEKVWRGKEQIWPLPLREKWEILDKDNELSLSCNSKEEAEEHREKLNTKIYRNSPYRIVHMREVRE